MEQVYILRVLDADDDYLYMTLVLRTKKEFDKAVELIREFDDDYYEVIDGEKDYEDRVYTGNYYEDLLDYLDKHHIESIPITEDVIHVR